MIRMARESDFRFLRGFSGDPPDEQLAKQIQDGRLRIVESEAGQLGFIKFYVLWEILPFMEVIIIREELRRRGFGRQAVRAWDGELLAGGFRSGYRDCGSLELPGRPIELFMYRAIG